MKSKTFLNALSVSLFAAVLSVNIACSSQSKKELSPAQKKAKLFYNHGTRNLISQDYTQALKNLKQAASLDPENSDIHNNLGMAYYFKKSEKKAELHIKKAVKLNPQNTDAKLNLASIHLKNNSLAEAERLYNNILEDLTYEGQHRTYYNLGVVALKRNNTARAIENFNKSLEVSAGYCPAHFKLGELAYKKGRYSAAFKSYKEAGMGTCYENPEPFLGQIESLIKMNRFSDALVKLEDMQERFAMTKYEALARRTMQKVKALQAKKEDNAQVYSKKLDSSIQSLDF
ncbi:MAG: tetratricopeptide repeat protein [Bacteriovoracaceae bacterium]